MKLENKLLKTITEFSKPEDLTMGLKISVPEFFWHDIFTEEQKNNATRISILIIKENKAYKITIELFSELYKDLKILKQTDNYLSIGLPRISLHKQINQYIQSVNPYKINFGKITEFESMLYNLLDNE